MTRIWAIADTHLSFAKPKPMDVFGDHWRDHPARIAQNCRAVMDPDDLLLIPGDLSLGAEAGRRRAGSGVAGGAAGRQGVVQGQPRLLVGLGPAPAL